LGYRKTAQHANVHLKIAVTNMAINPDQPISFSRLHRLQWEEAQQKHVILYPEGMVELNQSSAAILQMCDGTRKLAEIVSDLENQFAATGLHNDISAFLEVALSNGWIQQH
jgi:coenzyme PQQ biosynthesis protein PqqD